jgi:hypothetical protein
MLPPPGVAGRVTHYRVSYVHNSVIPYMIELAEIERQATSLYFTSEGGRPNRCENLSARLQNRTARLNLRRTSERRLTTPSCVMSEAIEMARTNWIHFAGNALTRARLSAGASLA